MARPIPPQVTRLLVLTLGIVVTYLVARYFLTPPSFGQYGWFRGNAIPELASGEPVYAGRKACATCHTEQEATLSKAGHQNLSCEVCHGPGQEHCVKVDVKPAILHFSHCVRCHEAEPSRPTWMKQVNSRDHYPGEACTGCHAPHEPIEKQ